MTKKEKKPKMKWTVTPLQLAVSLGLLNPTVLDTEKEKEKR